MYQVGGRWMGQVRSSIKRVGKCKSRLPDDVYMRGRMGEEQNLMGYRSFRWNTILCPVLSVRRPDPTQFYFTFPSFFFVGCCIHPPLSLDFIPRSSWSWSWADEVFLDKVQVPKVPTDIFLKPSKSRTSKWINRLSVINFCRLGNWSHWAYGKKINLKFERVFLSLRSGDRCKKLSSEWKAPPAVNSDPYVWTILGIAVD